jgi:hypothetical protein
MYIEQEEEERDLYSFQELFFGKKNEETNPSLTLN